MTKLIDTLPSPKDVVDEAKEKFSTNVYLRLIHYARHGTMRGRALNRKPAMLVPDFIGGHGEGKTAIAETYVLTMLGLHGSDVPFETREAALARHLTIVDGGGITDIADLTGLSYINPYDLKAGGEIRTRLARSVAYGDDDMGDLPPDQRFRVILIDDWTRSLSHVLQALKEIINRGRFNSFRIPPNAFIICGRNPEGGDYNVTGIDPAQLSRTIPISYEARVETFYEQLQLQQSNQTMMNFWLRHTELCTPKTFKVEPVPEAKCSRFNTLWTHYYDYLEHDDLACQKVALSMFGPQFLPMIQTWKRAEQPIDPKDILSKWSPAMATKLEDYTKKGHQDVLTVTLQRLGYFLNDPSTNVPDAELDHVLDVMNVVPEDSAFMLGKLLMEKGQPRREHYSQRLSALGANRPAEENANKRIIKLRNAINEKMGIRTR